MTDSTSAAATAATPVPKVSFWEDVIDIFFQPATVFRRRQGTSAWPPMLFVALSIGIIVFATFNTIEPIFAAEFQRGIARAATKGPAPPPELMNKMLGYSEAAARYGISVIILITMFILGVVAWLLGRLVGSKQTFGDALVVAAWSYVPRVIGSVLGAIQGLLMDPAKLNAQLAISLSPARFMDPDTPNQLLYQAAGQLDLINLWICVLLSIGLYVTGKVSKERAWMFGLLVFVVTALPALRQGYSAM